MPAVKPMKIIFFIFSILFCQQLYSQVEPDESWPATPTDGLFPELTAPVLIAYPRGKGAFGRGRYDFSTYFESNQAIDTGQIQLIFSRDQGTVRVFRRDWDWNSNCAWTGPCENNSQVRRRAFYNPERICVQNPNDYDNIQGCRDITTSPAAGVTWNNRDVCLVSSDLPKGRHPRCRGMYTDDRQTSLVTLFTADRVTQWSVRKLTNTEYTVAYILDNKFSVVKITVDGDTLNVGSVSSPIPYGTLFGYKYTSSSGNASPLGSYTLVKEGKNGCDIVFYAITGTHTYNMAPRDCVPEFRKTVKRPVEPNPALMMRNPGTNDLELSQPLDPNARIALWGSKKVAIATTSRPPTGVLLTSPATGVGTWRQGVLSTCRTCTSQVGGPLLDLSRNVSAPSTRWGCQYYHMGLLREYFSCLDSVVPAENYWDFTLYSVWLYLPSPIAGGEPEEWFFGANRERMEQGDLEGWAPANILQFRKRSNWQDDGPLTVNLTRPYGCSGINAAGRNYPVSGSCNGRYCVEVACLEARRGLYVINNCNTQCNMEDWSLMPIRFPDGAIIPAREPGRVPWRGFTIDKDPTNPSGIKYRIWPRDSVRPGWGDCEATYREGNPIAYNEFCPEGRPRSIPRVWSRTYIKANRIIPYHTWTVYDNRQLLIIFRETVAISEIILQGKTGDTFATPNFGNVDMLLYDANTNLIARRFYAATDPQPPSFDLGNLRGVKEIRLVSDRSDGLNNTEIIVLSK